MLGCDKRGKKEMKKQQEPRPQTGSPWIPRMEDPERGRGHSARVKETGNMDGDPSTCWLLLLPGALAQSPEQEMELGTTIREPAIFTPK